MEARRREPEREEQREARMEPVEARRTPEPIEARRVTEPEHGGATFGMRDLSHWGPVWAGVIGGFAVLILLTLLGLGIGLAAFDPIAGAAGVGTSAFIWGAIILLLSYFVAGWLAGRTSSFRGSTWSAFVLGSLVWALSVVLLVLATSLGIAGVLGAVVSPFNIVLAPGVSAAEAITAAATTAIWSFFVLLLAWAAAFAGAYVGVRSMMEEGYER
ncbi:MAG: hypothetical protein ACOX87_05015 [Chloroflexota bacterium]|jgi:hypothetical protein